MSRCLIGLGSNVGDRARQLDFAVRRLRETPGVELLAHSRWIETKPIGGPSGQSLYLNGAALVETAIEPLPLLDILHQIEDDAGRQRAEHWGPRTLDLDLLLYGDASIGDMALGAPRLIVPHPRLALRRFVLEPAAEVAPMMLHPLLGRTMADLWRHVCQAPRYVAFTGMPARARADLARAAAAATGATLLEGRGEDLERRLAGSASPPWDVAIEFVARWSELLSAERWPQAGWVVSDFHWPDLAADLFRNLDARALQGTRPRDLRARITAAGRKVSSPRFLVSLASAVEGTADTAERRAIEKAGIPVLRVSAASREAAVSEIVAAVQALTE